MKILQNIPISTLTTMRIGGNASYVIEIESKEDIASAYDFAKTHNLPVFILGGGANTIGRDEGYDGVIIINKMTGINIEDTVVRAMGGEIWDNVVAASCKHGLTGIEALSKIPGTAGAAPVQNIGAYGQDVAQVLESIEAYDTRDEKFVTLSNADLNFSYRKSILNSDEHGRFFVISITLRLSRGEMVRPFYNSIERYISENNISDFSPASIRNIVSTIRADKLPDPEFIPSSGSFFKNVYLSDEDACKYEAAGLPVYRGHDGNKINSGWLIENSGLSNALIHGMRVNPKAALVLINESAKSYEDLANARAEIIDVVYKKYGFRLEQEPVEIA